ncbi:MAG TPA: hypothetical protein VEO53_06150, partial [Candidatus Binatia bacterium]|nr:hypothetical protein [Candidatus Binatia bacterium]
MGLVQEMLAKGQLSEAQQVVVYLKTIAPANVIQGLELQLATQSGDAAQLLPNAVALLTVGAASLAPAEKLRWADQLVVAFAPVTAESPEAAQLAGEVRRIHEALDAIAAGQSERALEAVRPLSRDSVFSHWRMFVKGLAAFHGGQAEKAARCFAELPADSVPGRAREPYLLVVGKTEAGLRSWPENIIEVAGRLGAQPRWGRLLTRAQALWLAQRHVDSYKVLRDAVPDFPREGLDALGVLSDFYFNALFTLPEEAGYQCENFLLSIEEANRAKNPTELKMIRRVFSQLLAARLDSFTLRTKWESVLREHERTHGANPLLASLAYGWLGEVLGRARRPGLFGSGSGGKAPLRDAPGAIDALQKSIALDPANLAAPLRLCAVYEALKMNSERNRLLDSMTARFPYSKEVLVLAGAGCLDRQAYLKGLEYLEQALQVDRIDPAVPDLMVSGLERLARLHFQKSRVDEARATLARAEEFLIEQPENFLRNRWCHLARRGLLEQLHGDAAQSAALLAQARAASPFPAAFLLFAQTAWRSLAEHTKGNGPFEAELNAVAKENPGAARGLALARIHLFWRNVSDSRELINEENWLRHYLKRAAKNPCARDEARQLVELLEPHPAFSGEAMAFVSMVLKKDPADPLFRLYEDLLRPFRLRDPENDQNRLLAILDEATRRGDEKAVQLARELLADLNVPVAPKPDWDEDEDEEFDEDLPDSANFPLPP